MGFQQDHYVWRTSGERTQAIILDPVLPGSEVRLIDSSHVHTSPAVPHFSACIKSAGK